MAQLRTKLPSRLLDRLSRSARTVPKSAARGVFRAVQIGGRGSVEDQFRTQGTISGDGQQSPWKPAQRVLLHGGVTLVLTGAYMKAWTGRGSGTIARVASQGGRTAYQVGVDRRQFPQVDVFQAESQVGHVAPRPVSLNSFIVERAGKAVLDELFKGAA